MMGERCREHGYYEAGVGICSVCLTERLAKVAQNNTFPANNNVYVQPSNLDAPCKKSPSFCKAEKGGGTRRSSSSSSLSALFTSDTPSGGAAIEEKDKFISLDFQQREMKPTSWVSSLLRKSKRRERSSFSGRPSLDNKMGAYEKEVVRRQEALKAGGWEVQLCNDGEERRKEKEAEDYYSDSSVTSKHARIRSLFRKQPCKNLKEKMNPKVAHCVLVDNGGADHLGVSRKYTSWTKTLASPLWKPKTGRKKDASMASSSSFACINISSPLGQSSSSSLWHTHKPHCNSSAS